MRESLKNATVDVGSFALFVALFIGMPVAASRLLSHEEAPIVSASAAGNSGDVSVSSESNASGEFEMDEAVADTPDKYVDCNPNYDPCVEDSSYDLDCADIGFGVTVTGMDEYGLDYDGDNIGCESY